MQTKPIIFIPALIALLLAASVNAPASAQDAPGRAIGLSSRTVALEAGDSSKRRVGRLDYLGGVELSSPDPDFGGFSALHLDQAGKRLTAVSDRAHWLEADLFQNGDGTLVGVANARMGPLRGLNGEPMKASRHTDSEGLAVLPGGDWLVSFERQHRFRRYPAGAHPLAGRPVDLPKPPGIDAAPYNGGMEALVTLNDGRLLVFTEDLRNDNGTASAVFLRDGEKTWQRLSLETTGPFKPTGAALLPDGDVVLLERRFSLVGGLGIRVSRIAAADIVPGARLKTEELARLRPPLTVDNMEGIHARRGPDGRSVIYLLSDDNFKTPLQSTLLLAFAIRE